MALLEQQCLLSTVNQPLTMWASNVGKEGQDVVRHLRQRLAVLLVRDNVAMLSARTPSFAHPEVDGDIE